jgi:hypothetical protein
MKTPPRLMQAVYNIFIRGGFISAKMNVALTVEYLTVCN